VGVWFTAQTAEQIRISKGDRELMERLLCAGNTPQKVAFRINIVPGAGAGIFNAQLARDFATTKSSVLKWRGRFVSSGLSGILEDAPRIGRKSISPEKEAAIVMATLRRPRSEGYNRVVPGNSVGRFSGDPRGRNGLLYFTNLGEAGRGEI
jgi:hypothetical protein